MKIILSCLMIVGAVMAAEGEGFEAPAVQAGTALPERWQGNGAVEVSSEQSAGGEQSLKVGLEGEVRYGVRIEDVVFVDLQVLPIAGTKEVLNIAGARLGFGTNGKISVFEGSAVGGREIQNGNYEVENGVSAAWVRITVRIDADRKKWDVWIDGRPAEADLDLGEGGAVLVASGTASGAVYLDDFVLGEENPIFLDADRDGMPDAEEKANGLNAFGDDRNGDRDGDGISNIEEMFAGTSPQAPRSLSNQVAQLVYVDNLNGNDANTGERSYVATGSDGPKASIKAAMASAPGGGVIVVLKGRGSYDEGSRGIAGKPLTIKTVEPVTIK